MVREVRVAWNDPEEHERFRPLPVDDDTDDWDESPLEPPPPRRCSRRRPFGTDRTRRTDPAGTPAPLPNPPNANE